MQLMDELTEEYSPPEKLTVLTRSTETVRFLWKGSSQRSHNAIRTEWGQSNSLHLHPIFIYNLSYYYTVIYAKYTQMVISLHDSRCSRLLHLITL